MTAELEEITPPDEGSNPLVPDTFIVNDLPNGENVTIDVEGPADAAFKATQWALLSVREQLVLAREQKLGLNAYIRTLVAQEKKLARMARIASEALTSEGETGD